ncbi:MAG: TlpA disulfide reductase family protein [Isosphaeraceae bacterium]|nr:TlpA disulfide reductase family protein [Isosphaeraceae bacterium]
MGYRTRVAWSVATFLIAIAGSSASARAADAEARKRIEAAAAAYAALPAYADKGEITVEIEVAGEVRKDSIAVPVRLARPNLLSITTPLVSIVSDGNAILTVVPSLKRWSKAPAPQRITHDDLSEGPLGAFERGGPIGMPTRVLATLLLDPEAVKSLARDAVGFSTVPAKSIDGVECEGIVVDSDTAPGLILRIDPKTKLVVAMEIDPTRGAKGDSEIPGSPVVFKSFTWRAGKIDTTPPADLAASFAAVPPEGTKEILALAAQKVEAIEHPLVGKPAPDFTLNLLEKGGKTRRARIDEFQDKIVLIDFWAMWCGPCRKEMPDIAKLSDDLAKAGKPVVFIALSIDRPEEIELPELEKKVRADIAILGFDIEKAENRRLALDPSGTTARAFGVTAIPMLVLLDGKGIVRAVHVGMTERDVLAAEIEALLEGKPLPKP